MKRKLYLVTTDKHKKFYVRARWGVQAITLCNSFLQTTMNPSYAGQFAVSAYNWDDQVVLPA
jgi:hypothetical protein